MKCRNTVITFFVVTVTVASLSLLKVGKEYDVIGFTLLVVGVELMIALKDEDNLNKKVRDYEYFLIDHKMNLRLRIMKR